MIFPCRLWGSGQPANKSLGFTQIFGFFLIQIVVLPYSSGCFVGLRDFRLKTFLHWSLILIKAQKLISRLLTSLAFSKKRWPHPGTIWTVNFLNAQRIRLTCVSLWTICFDLQLFYQNKNTLLNTISSLGSGLVAEWWSAFKTLQIGVFPSQPTLRVAGRLKKATNKNLG